MPGNGALQGSDTWFLSVGGRLQGASSAYCPLHQVLVQVTPLQGAHCLWCSCPFSPTPWTVPLLFFWLFSNTATGGRGSECQRDCVLYEGSTFTGTWGGGSSADTPPQGGPKCLSSARLICSAQRVPSFLAWTCIVSLPPAVQHSGLLPALPPPSSPSLGKVKGLLDIISLILSESRLLGKVLLP